MICVTQERLSLILGKGRKRKLGNGKVSKIPDFKSVQKDYILISNNEVIWSGLRVWKCNSDVENGVTKIPIHGGTKTAIIITYLYMLPQYNTIPVALR